MNVVSLAKRLYFFTAYSTGTRPIPFKTTCSWYITSPPGTRIELDFQEFYLKTNQPKSCSGAYLEVVDDGSRTNFKICENSPGITLSNISQFETSEAKILETRDHNFILRYHYYETKSS